MGFVLRINNRRVGASDRAYLDTTTIWQGRCAAPSLPAFARFRDSVQKIRSALDPQKPPWIRPVEIEASR